MSNLSDQPRLLKGAFVEYGISIPPLLVVFQFNPETISRSRSNSYKAPGEGTKITTPLRKLHYENDDLLELRESQEVQIGSETISFDLRLDATQDLEPKDIINKQFGISPQISTLELMMYPKSEGLIGDLLKEKGGYSFLGGEKPPLILFIWGRKKVLPVNIDSLGIKEDEFSPDLNPIRATIGVKLTIIEGPNLPYQYSKALKEAMSLLNLTNITKVANTLIP